MSLQTVEKKDRLMSLVHSISRRKRSEYWLAGNDIDEEGVWEWARLRTVVPDFGWSEEPFNSGEENCLAWTVDQTVLSGRTDYWQGDSCCNNLRYVCEKGT